MRRRAPRLRGLVCVACVAVTLLAAGCASTAGGSEAARKESRSGVVISTPEDTSPYHGVEERRYELPDITLTAASGQPFNLAADTGKPLTLVFFGYTHCPDICPTTVATITRALRQAPDSVREQVRFVFVTSDPARDDPERLREWLGRFDDSYVGLTGDMDKIERAAKQLGVPLWGKQRLPSGGYLVGHGARVTAFGPEGSSRVMWTGGTSAGAYRDDIVRLVRTL